MFAPSNIWLLPSAPLLPHILGEGGGVSLGLVAQVTLVAIEPLLECSESLAIEMLLCHGQSTFTVPSLPCIVHHHTRENLLGVGFDD